MFFWGTLRDYFQDRRVDRIALDTRRAQRESGGRLAELEKRVAQLEQRSGALEDLFIAQTGVSRAEIAAALNAHAASAAPQVGTCTSCGRLVTTRDGRCMYCGGAVDTD